MTNPGRVHFTGIKGVGMAATALCYQDLGWDVTGSDVEEKFVTDEMLDKRNIKIFDNFDESRVDKELDLLIYTGAHGGVTNEEVVKAAQAGVRNISQAEAVGELMNGKTGISVCGVGGKSTTSAMIATMLSDANKKPGYLIGVGEVKGLEYPGKVGEGEQFVAEADEYVISPGTNNAPRFSFQKPKMLVCTNLAYDHPDVYNSFEETKKTFVEFFKKIQAGGVLVINGDDEELVKAANEAKKETLTYGFGNNCIYRITDIEQTSEGEQGVKVTIRNEKRKFWLGIDGRHNAMNGVASLVVGEVLKLSSREIINGLRKFGGIKRRLETIGEKNGILYLDDYAHHPLEIRSTIKTIRKKYAKRRLVVAFQPHTFSRTKSLFNDFSHSFKEADKVVITDIFASAREQVDSSVSGEMLADTIAKNGKSVDFVKSDDLVEYMSSNLRKGDVFVTMGAGDIYKIYEQIFKK